MFFLIIIFFTFQLSFSQIIEIPDETLKKYIVEGSFVTQWDGADANNDGEIQLSEALTVTILDMNYVFNAPFPVTNLEGLQYFTNLEIFTIGYHRVSDFSPIGQLPNLRQLDCRHQNPSSTANSVLYSIDVSGLINLEVFNCVDNNISHLDLSQNPNIQSLEAHNNTLLTLNIKNGTSQDEISFFENPDFEFLCKDDTDITPLPGDFGYNDFEISDYCPFIPNGITYQVEGIVNFDVQNNGCITGEGIPYNKLNVTNGTDTQSISTNGLGEYYIPLRSGNFTISPVMESTDYYTITPNEFQVDFPAVTSPANQDFCIKANGTHTDLEVVIAPEEPARPGFQATYILTYKNKGNQTQTGNVTLLYNETILNYIASEPLFDSETANSFSWNFTDLQPFESREIDISFLVNSPTDTPPVVNGDILEFTVEITPSQNDETPADNVFTLNQTTVGSYDPNDITCLEGSKVDESYIGNYVHYLIRFENTGTFAAENVAIRDILNEDEFDIDSVVLLNSSHEVVLRTENNILEFLFEGINLPFEEPENKGFVTFKVRLDASLNHGDVFSNFAEIYFDYNEPIITNTANTEIEKPLSNDDFNLTETFKVIPNPVGNILNVLSSKHYKMLDITIFNTTGKIVKKAFVSNNQLDVSSLDAGIYFIKFQNEEGNHYNKMIKE